MKADWKTGAPPAEGWYVVTLSDGDVVIAMWRQLFGEWCWATLPNARVTAWDYRPEPWKGGTK